MQLLKSALFHVLWTFRFIKFWLKGLSVFITTFFIIELFIGGIPFMLKLMTFCMGLSLSAFAWYYDTLLLKLQPKGTNLVLFN